MGKHKNRQHWLTQPPEQQPSSRIVGITHEQHYSGPIPPASELAKYEQACAGAANRIIAMAEKQEEHRHSLESAVVTSNVRNERLGMHYACGLTVGLMLLGAILIFTGKETAGYFAVFGPVVFQSGNFVYHKTRERRISKPKQDESKV